MFLTGLEPLMEKIAARRGLKEIRKKVDAGDIEGANRLAITPGVLKKTQAGSQVKTLGAGAEGGATLMAHPKRGLDVEKLIDPQGIMGDASAPGGVTPATYRREALQEHLKGSPDLAEFHGARMTPGGLRAQRFEYMHGKGLGQEPVSTSEPSTAPSPAAARATQERRQPSGANPKMSPQRRAEAQLLRLKRQGERAGTQVIDTHAKNVKALPGGKGGKAIDFMAMPPKSNKSAPGINQTAYTNLVGAQDAAILGARTPYRDYLDDPRRQGNLRAQAYRGAAPLEAGSSTLLRKQRPESFGLAKGDKSPTLPPPVPPKPKRAPIPAMRPTPPKLPALHA